MDIARFLTRVDKHCRYSTPEPALPSDSRKLTGQQHKPDGLEYVWVDTCCIDKSSSAELTQAINSMFAWYQRANICLVYLSDVVSHADTGSAHVAIKDSLWFRRGWTLQELIAPKSMVIFDSTWHLIGEKDDLLDELAQITLVSRDVLSHKSALSSVCVAQRLSWASNRDTTRVEDQAYCLLGILEINMPLLYGEGVKAFYRLQEEVLRSINDLSIFSWSPNADLVDDYCGFFAESPKDFSSCSTMQLVAGAALEDIPIFFSSRGVEITIPEYILVSDFENTPIQYQYALKINCKTPDTDLDFLTVPMRKIGPNVFLRTRWVDTNSFEPVPVKFRENERKDLVLVTRLPKTDVHADIVSSSRHTQVDIEFLGWNPQENTREVPTKAWDIQDQAFFGTGSSLHNWAGVSFDDLAFFVCIWSKVGDIWDIEGFLSDNSSEAMGRVWRDLFLYADTFGFRARSVRDMMGGIQGRKRGRLRFLDSGRSREISFVCRPRPSLAVCSGPRWVVELRELKA
jgi:hypothetical protein